MNCIAADLLCLIESIIGQWIHAKLLIYVGTNVFRHVGCTFTYDCVLFCNRK